MLQLLADRKYSIDMTPLLYSTIDILHIYRVLSGHCVGLLMYLSVLCEFIVHLLTANLCCFVKAGVTQDSKSLPVQSCHVWLQHSAQSNR